ncbi:MAG TPA: hypothetical protein VK105_07480 [Virgibacillus sp.]|nr:hypothetical protein [Virgibacillus sp.]HLR66963.1 hypothetical protein [Virgibacillus sp.]
MHIFWILVSLFLIIAGIWYFLMSAKQYRNKDDEEQRLHMKNGKSIISLGVLGLFVAGAVNILNLI